MKFISKVALVVVTISFGVMLLIGSISMSPGKLQAISGSVNPTIEYKEVSDKYSTPSNNCRVL